MHLGDPAPRWGVCLERAQRGTDCIVLYYGINYREISTATEGASAHRARAPRAPRAEADAYLPVKCTPFSDRCFVKCYSKMFGSHCNVWFPMLFYGTAVLSQPGYSRTARAHRARGTLTVALYTCNAYLEFLRVGILN